MHFYPEFEDLRTTLYRMANTHSHTRKKKHTQTDNIFHPGHRVLTGVLLKEFLDSELGKGTGKQRSCYSNTGKEWWEEKKCSTFIS